MNKNYHPWKVNVKSVFDRTLSCLYWKCELVFKLLDAGFHYPNGPWRRLIKIKTLHTLISGEGGIMSIYHLDAIPFQFSRGGHLCNVTLILCGPLETTSNTFLVTPLW